MDIKKLDGNWLAGEVQAAKLHNPTASLNFLNCAIDLLMNSAQPCIQVPYILPGDSAEVAFFKNANHAKLVERFLLARASFQFIVFTFCLLPNLCK